MAATVSMSVTFHPWPCQNFPCLHENRHHTCFMLHSVIPRAYTRHAEGPRLSLVLRRAQTVRYDVFIKTRMLTLSAPNTQTSAEMQEASLRAHV